MNSLTICSQNINVIDDLYSLNDLHKASGNQNKHRPTFFLQNQETKELIAEIESEKSSVGNPTVALRVINGGLNRGTYVCKELVYRYAMWISAKFSLMVIRAFDSLVTRTDSKQREVLRQACEKLATGNMLISDAYILVGKQFGYDDGIKNIPTPLLPEATAFVYEMILRLNKTPQPTLTTEQTKSITRLIVEVWQLNTMTAGTFLQTVILYDRDKLDYYKGFYKGVHRACIEVVSNLGLKGSGNLPLITGRTVNAPSGVRFNVDSALI